MEAIVLAGGFGTRLKHIVSDVPKPMADIAGKPFLNYVLDYLIINGVNRIVLATGYLSEKIEAYYGDVYKGVPLVYSVEKEPLWTGGAIKKALNATTDTAIVVVNGDTLFKANLKELYEFFIEKNAQVAIAGRSMTNFDRYGTLNIQNGKVVSFVEKQKMLEGIINGGVYILDRNVFDDINADKFSFENDFLEKDTVSKKIFVKVFDDYFIDIGIEQDYLRAQKELL